MDVGRWQELKKEEFKRWLIQSSETWHCHEGRHGTIRSKYQLKIIWGGFTRVVREWDALDFYIGLHD